MRPSLRDGGALNSVRPSGRGTSVGGGEARRRVVQRVDINVVGATRPDAGQPAVRPGGQYAQANPTPVISAKQMEKILERHKFGSADLTAGKFTPEYSNEEAIHQLVEDAWKQAAPDGVGPGYWNDGRAVIAAQVMGVTDGIREPDIICKSFNLI